MQPKGNRPPPVKLNFLKYIKGGGFNKLIEKKIQLSKQRRVTESGALFSVFAVASRGEPQLTCSSALKANTPQVSTVSWIKHILLVVLFIKHKLLKTVCSLALIGTQATLITAAGKRKNKKLLICLFILAPALSHQLRNKGDAIVNL